MIPRLTDFVQMKEAKPLGGIIIDTQEATGKVVTNVSAELVDKDGNVIETIDFGSNVITYLGRSNMAHLLAGDDTANRVASTIKCGDGGHDPGDPTVPLAVDVSDTDLYGTEIIAKTVSYDFPDGSSGGKVRFTAEVAANEGNGSGSQAYSEVGLYDLADRMIAHRSFGLITKSEAFGIIWRWTFIFSLFMMSFGSVFFNLFKGLGSIWS